MSGTTTTAYAANDPSILYSPYTWGFTTVSGYAFAVTTNGGSRLRFQFNASGLTGLTLNFFTGQATNNAAGQAASFWIRVDDGPWQIAQVANSAITCALPNWSASWPVHTVELRVRSIPTAVSRWVPASAGLPPPAACAFTGYSVTATSSSSAPAPIAKARNVLVMGDSQTEGWINLANAEGQVDATGGTDGMDTTAGWAFLLGEQLGAEIAVVGQSGLGFINLPASGVPGWASSWNYLWQGQARTFSPVPDLLVFMVGGDDLLGYVGGNSNCSPAAVQAQYTSMLQGVIAAMPTLAPSRIACLTSMPGAAAAQIPAATISAFKGAIQGAAAAVSPAIAYIDSSTWFGASDPSFDGAHPLAPAHVNKIAPLAGNALRPLLYPAGRSYVFE